MSGSSGKAAETVPLSRYSVDRESDETRRASTSTLTQADLERQLPKEAPVPFHQTVVFAVSFYMASSIVMVMANKKVLTATPLPITFLWMQLLVAVALLYISDFAGLFAIPKQLDPKICYGLIPLVSINVIGLTFNTLCLHFVDASLYQVARSLILPLTVGFSWILLKKPSSLPVLAGCGIVVAGFLLGTLLEDKELKVSFWGITFGVLSSITTASHAVVISRSLEVVDGSLMSLVFYNNVLSSVGLAPFVIFSGELAGLRDLLSQGGEHLTTLIWGTLLTGFFGFMLNLAGFLQIKVTSPITHMISSALRGVLQTVIAVWLFGDIVTAQRVVGIAFILAGSSYYTWVRSVEMEQEKGGRK